jgi:hypothetical protein
MELDRRNESYSQSRPSDTWNDPDILVDDVLVPIRLPRTDGGKAAWLFLAAGFVIEALVWGLFWSSPCNP